MKGKHQSFVARMDQLDAAARFIEDGCRAAGVADRDRLRALLVVEELFTNSVRHGHGGHSDAALRIGIAVTGPAIELFFEDHAAAFDPLAATAASTRELDLPLGQRALGGLGIHLVRSLAGSVRYAREDGCNRLWVSLPRSD